MKHSKVCFTLLMLLSFSFPHRLMAEQSYSHVVSVEELRGGLATRSVERLRSIREVQHLLSQEAIQKHVGSLANLERIEKGLLGLEDETLRQLAGESQKINDQLRAGVSVWVVVLLVAVIVVVIAAVALSQEST